MHFTFTKYIIFILVFFAKLSMVRCNVLEAERASFLGFTQEVKLSLTTLELAETLTQAVLRHVRGDRRVRRYFDAYDTPFIGVSRRKMDGWYGEGAEEIGGRTLRKSINNMI